MRIGIDCGHTLNGADYGAVGIKAESNLTREVGTKVIDKLQELGHTVIKCYKDTCSSLMDSLSYRTNVANDNNLDLYVSIHFNCYNTTAHGTEVFTYGGKEIKEAKEVLNNLVALGYTNRGIKDGSNLYVLRNTKAKAMLIEVCFCDNAEDMNIFNSENTANAIVKGITGFTMPTLIKNINEEFDMNKIVVYFGDVDVFASIMLAQKLGCALIKESDLGNIKSKEIIRVGGPNSSVSKGDRFDTFKGVANKL